MYMDMYHARQAGLLPPGASKRVEGGDGHDLQPLRKQSLVDERFSGFGLAEPSGRIRPYLPPSLDRTRSTCRPYRNRRSEPTNAFTREGRTDRQNEAWDFLQRLLTWRKGNKAVTQGRLVHYAPDASDCYVYARLKDDATVLVVLNGSDKEQTLPTARFREVIGTHTAGKEVLSGETLPLGDALTIPARGVYILELR